MKKYTLTFIWNQDYSDVILISKLRPEWQKGFFNGVGGKYEESDCTIFHAATREIKEETGLSIGEKELYQFAEIVGKDYIVYCFSCAINNSKILTYKSMTDEQVVLWHPGHPRPIKYIPNLEFIVPLSKRKDYYTVFYTD